MIDLKKLTVGYHSPLISFSDMELKRGNVYALIGRNGIGKSTFLKTITGQIKPISGTIEVDNQQLSDLTFSELPKFIAYVESHFPLVEFLSVYDYIALGRSPYTNLLGKLKEEDKTFINQTIQQLNIEHLINRFTSELSDGERQLISIAKAVVQQTDLIVLDEPTAFLDYANKEEVLSQLLNIANEMNKCIIVATHDIDLVLDKKIQFILIDETEKIGNLYLSSTKKEIISTCFKSIES